MATKDSKRDAAFVLLGSKPQGHFHRITSAAGPDAGRKHKRGEVSGAGSPRSPDSRSGRQLTMELTTKALMSKYSDAPSALSHHRAALTVSGAYAGSETAPA